MKILSNSILLLLCFFAMAAYSIETDNLQGLGDTRYHKIKSADFGRSVHVYAILPDGYSDNSRETYPTIYLTTTS